MRNVFGDPAKVTPALVDRYFDLTLREGNRRALAQRFEQTPSGSGADRIPQLRVPTLILWGGRDRLIAPSDAERFHHDIPGSRVLVFEELGHVPQEEDATRTVAAVKSVPRRGVRGGADGGGGADRGWTQTEVAAASPS